MYRHKVAKHGLGTKIVGYWPRPHRENAVHALVARCRFAPGGINRPTFAGNLAECAVLPAYRLVGRNFGIGFFSDSPKYLYNTLKESWMPANTNSKQDAQ